MPDLPPPTGSLIRWLCDRWTAFFGDHPRTKGLIDLLTDYLYVNEAVLADYLEQLGLGDRRILRRIRSKTSLSIAGPRIESTRDHVYEEPPLHKRIVQLEKALSKKGLLATERPRAVFSAHTAHPRFFTETTIASKLILAKSALQGIDGVKSFALWVSDPNPADLAHDWNFTGTFLLLTELHLDDHRFETTHSGCSALQAVVNGLQGNPLLVGARGEPLGRGGVQHPIEKLQRVTAVVNEPRKIRALYRVRYMTNEQCYIYKNERYRVNDLLAYPIFIAAA